MQTRREQLVHIQHQCRPMKRICSCRAKWVRRQRSPSWPFPPLEVGPEGPPEPDDEDDDDVDEGPDPYRFWIRSITSPRLRSALAPNVRPSPDMALSENRESDCTSGELCVDVAVAAASRLSSSPGASSIEGGRTKAGKRDRW